MIENLQFSLFELIALFGMVQSVSVLVYMGFRAGSFKQALIPFIYFSLLGAAFYAEFARLFLVDLSHSFAVLAFVLWAFIPALSTLLIVQLVKMPRLPSLSYFCFLLLPVGLSAAIISDFRMNDMGNVAYWSLAHIVLGALALLGVWFKRGLLDQLYRSKEKAGRERYWLSIALVFFNVLFLGGAFLDMVGAFQEHVWPLLRLILPNVFIYLASTGLFRIYPQAAIIAAEPHPKSQEVSVTNNVLNDAERACIARIEHLFDVEKIYHEANLTRTELARELNLSESQLSKLVNVHYQKSVPQLLNSYRVQDAIALIEQTKAPIKDIAAEAGFSSIATFNRVFKEQTGRAPSDYREAMKHIIH